MKTQEQFAEEILEQCMNGTSISNLMVTLEEYRVQIASQLEPLVMPANAVQACGHCEHCKLDDDKTSASQGKHYCERHGENIFEMFTETAFGENLTLETVGCRQFKRASKSA